MRRNKASLGTSIKRASVVPECASGVGVVPQVKLWNVVGLFIIVASVLVVGFAIGITEIIYRCSCAQLACCKKKVAVEPKVQGCMQYRMLTSRPSRVFPPMLLIFFVGICDVLVTFIWASRNRTSRFLLMRHLFYRSSSSNLLSTAHLLR